MHNEISSALSRVDSVIPRLGETTNMCVSALIECAKVAEEYTETNLGIVPLHSKDNGLFQSSPLLSAVLCINAATKIAHTEKDVNYTLITVPRQEERKESFTHIFQFMFNSDLTINIGMHSCLSFIYSAWMLTHRQQRLRRVNSEFMNIAGYSPKRLFHNIRKSYVRVLQDTLK